MTLRSQGRFLSRSAQQAIYFKKQLAGTPSGLERRLVRKLCYCPEVKKKKKAMAKRVEHLTKAHNLAHSVMGEVCRIQGHLGYPSGGVLPGQGIVGGSSSVKL